MLIIPASQAYLPPADTTPAATTTYEPTEHPAKTPKQPNPEDTVVTTYEPTKRPTETNKVPDPTVTTYEPTKRPTKNAEVPDPAVTTYEPTERPTTKFKDPDEHIDLPKHPVFTNVISRDPDNYVNTTVTFGDPTDKTKPTITEDSTTIKPTRKSVDPSGNTIAGAPKYNFLSARPDTRPSPSPATCP